MQREILFKAKRKDNGEWIEGYLVEYIQKDTVYINGTSLKTSYIFPMNERSELKCLETRIEVIPETVSQYTGLDDINGKKIFENDILQGFEEYYDEFVKGMVDLDLYNGIQLVIKENSCHFDYIYDYEVIGNVFDEDVK